MKEEKKKTLREQQEPQKRFLFFSLFYSANIYS